MCCYVSPSLAEHHHSQKSTGQTPLQKSTSELHQVIHSIKRVKQNIVANKTQKNSLENHLKHIELAISQTSIALRHTHQQLQKEQQNLIALRAKQQHLLKKKHQQQTALAKQIRSIYRLGRHHTIKLFLNQQHPQNFSRTLKYYDYLNDQRVKIIHALNITLMSIKSTEQSIRQHTSQLNALSHRQQQQIHRLSQQQLQRQTVLQHINQHLKTQADKLSHLQQNALALKKIIAQLKKQPRTFQKPKVPFGSFRGKLPWPVKGKIRTHFNQSMGIGVLRYNGILIATPKGKDVRAIFPGKVVFANWLRGTGLLVIIQHDKKFMSLYGHLNSILVKVGENINKGEIIATTGNSGGQFESGLYFQIRENGVPINPQHWCR